MDQGLKERLVGAAVLVAIAVWLIPWVLDGPEAPLESNGSSLQLPAAEEPMPMRTQTLRVGDAPEVVADASPARVVTAPVAQPAVATDPPPNNIAESRETPPAAAPAAKPPAPVAAVAAAGDWIVQLGVFGEEANARRLAQSSGTFGHKAEVSSYRSNGRTLYRVRVGPAATRAHADATASALRAHGIDARVVATDG